MFCINAIFLPAIAYAVYVDELYEKRPETVSTCADFSLHNDYIHKEGYQPVCEDSASLKEFSEYASGAEGGSTSPYTEDMLTASARLVDDICPLWEAAPEPLTLKDAQLLTCNMLKEASFARGFPEHAMRARNDVVIAWLLEKGVPFQNVGRAYIFHQNGKGFYVENTRFSEGMFFRDWQIVFGSLPQVMTLVNYEKRFILNLSGENTLPSPYEAPVIRLSEGWRVLDTALLPELLTLQEWQKRLQGEKAVVAISALDSPPELVVDGLPERPKERLRRHLAIEKHMPWLPEKIEAIVHEMPLSMRLEMYADVLEFREANPLYPLRWKADSLGQEVLYPWNSSDNKERLAKAFEELDSLQTFINFWGKQKNDEAMLQQIRAQMEQGSKRKDRVEFDLKLLHVD